jgi:hypothetical protein
MVDTHTRGPQWAAAQQLLVFIWEEDQHMPAEMFHTFRKPKKPGLFYIEISYCLFYFIFG